MTNRDMAVKTLQTLQAWGVRDICLCPGGRNAPFVFLLSENKNFKVHSAFDERGAGFYALGLSQASGRPTAVITTSGTAVAEVLPAVIEAHYTGTPLVVVSADRPQRMRGSGAPQTIEQKNIFSTYVEKCEDIQGEWPAKISWGRQGAVHLNVAFDEPLLEGEASYVPVEEEKVVSMAANSQFPSLLSQFLRSAKNPLLLISGLKSQEIEPVRVFMRNWPGLVYAESTSGLREVSHKNKIQCGDRFPRELVKTKQVDAIVRVGGVPTARVWRDIEGTEFPVLSLSSLPFAGLSQGGLCQIPMSQLADVKEFFTPSSNIPEILKQDAFLLEETQKLLNQYPLSEPSLVRGLSEKLKAETTVYVGNSLPIREWDLVAQRDLELPVKANRGANGIDGQIATALAYRQAGRDLCVLVGDLTAIYDANALWFLRNASLGKCHIVVLNNRGGKIFQRMFNHSLFYNQHNFNFKGWADSWNIPYALIADPHSQLPLASSVVELAPDLEQTDEFWKSFDLLWASSAAALGSRA